MRTISQWINDHVIYRRRNRRIFREKLDKLSDDIQKSYETIRQSIEDNPVYQGSNWCETENAIRSLLNKERRIP